MNPISLSISGFLSYRDPVTIDFTNIELACIAGANGAGKSSILDAITWALFGKARKTDDSLINMQSTIADVALVYEYETNIYRIHRINPRDKTKNLEFQILVSPPQTAISPDKAEWKTLTEHTIRATQQAIEDQLRLDYDTFINAAFFLQGNADSFTTQRAGKRKEILSNILGLGIWDQYRRQTFNRRRSLENEVHQINGRLEGIQHELDEEDERKARLAMLEGQLTALSQTREAKQEVLRTAEKMQEDLRQLRHTVGLLQKAYDDAQSGLDQLQTRLSNRQELSGKHSGIIERSVDIEKAYLDWKTAKEQLAQLDDEERKTYKLREQRSPAQLVIETERTRLLGLKDQYQQKKQDLKEQLASLPKLQSDMQAVEVKLADLHVKIEQRESLKTERQEKFDTLSQLKAEVPVLKEEMNDIKKHIETLEKPGTTLCPLCGQALEEHDRLQLVEKLRADGSAKADRYRQNQDRIKSLGSDIEHLDRTIVDFGNLDQNIIGLNRQADQLKLRLDDIETTRRSWDEEIKPELIRVDTALAEETYAKEARGTLAAVDEKIIAAGYNKENHELLKQRVNELKAAESDYQLLMNARSALEPLDNEIKDLEARVAERRGTVASQQAELDAQIAILAAKDAESPGVEAARQEVLKLQLEENTLRTEIGGARQKVEVLKTLKQRKTAANEEKETLNLQIAQHKQLERAFSKDGVPALLIEQALPQIEEKANQILEKLTSGSMNVRFVTQREYKDKSRDDRKETLDIQISDRAGIRDYEMYSGGEAFRINFSIRLALSEVLAKRAGAHLKLLVIDEGFGSQDALGRQRLVEAIQMVRDDYEKILVISHIEELKDSFPTRIEVSKSERGSTVQIT